MSPVSNLHKLAHLYGVQTAYYDVAHHRCPTSPESLMAILQALEAPLKNLDNVESALRQRRQELWQQLIEPVVVVWWGKPLLLDVRLPVKISDNTILGHLTLENGEQLTYQWSSSNILVTNSDEVDGVRYLVKRITWPNTLPLGYHQLILQVAEITTSTLIIVAPIKAFNPPKKQDTRKWGIFLPLYALKTKTSWGSGSYSILESLTEYVSGKGGGLVATLPLLATFLDEPFEPSPYAPVSRLLWNEFYLDMNNIPESKRCPPAQALITSSSFRKETDALSRLDYVDYKREMALKRQVLEILCRNLFAETTNSLEDLHRFITTNPLVEEYARFRATLEKRQTSWHNWPQRLRQGTLREGDYEEEVRRYHLYVQWLAQQQVEALSRKAREKNVALYLDLPLGVHPDGYDAWREQSIFVTNVSAGAPPDAVFTGGQDWCFPPVHPEKIRHTGYQYIISYIRHHLRYANILRIDHVMGLHRLFWIPKGLPPSQGLYVRYKTDELYAILALESHRHGSIIVGEDLGTVPREVGPAMSRHGLHRMYVLHYEMESNPKKALRSIPNNYVVSLNNHDMPTFAAFWYGLDIEDRLSLGFIDRASARRERKIREDTKRVLVTFLQGRGWLKSTESDEQAALHACLAFLSASKAGTVLINIEDLWLEKRPQNVPSSGQKYPNWQRKAQYTLEEFCTMPQVVDILHLIDSLRNTH